MTEIECLRQQLADMTKERDKAKAMPMRYRRMEFNAQLQDEAESLRQQLADSQKQVMLLRDRVDWLRRYGCKDDLALRVAQDVLAATEPKP